MVSVLASVILLTISAQNVLAQSDRPTFLSTPAPVTPPAPGKKPIRSTAPSREDIRVSGIHQEVEGSARHFRGHAELETTEMLLKADEIDYNSDTGEAEARGHVEYENFTNGEKLKCDSGEYNTISETGKFFDVSGSEPPNIQARPGLLTTSNPFYFQAMWAERFRERYVLYDGFVTDCIIPKPWWTLHASKFDVIPADRAIAYRATFFLRGVPLFYFPVFYKALGRNPRHSGFLTPNLGHSSRLGYLAGVGYYWAINPSYDLTYRLQYFSSRGLANTFDIRGKVREGTDFDFNLYGVKDRGVIVNGENQKQGGYLFAFNAKSDLGDGWFARAEINYLSSFLFRQSFTESFHEAIFSESHSVADVSKHWSTFAFNASFQRDENFQTTAPDDRIIIRRLPEFELLSREHKISDKVIPIYVSFEATGGLFHRIQPQYDTAQFVGRTDFEPRIETVLRLGHFALVPSFSLGETFYSASFSNSYLDTQPVVGGGNRTRGWRQLTVDLVIPSIGRVYKAPIWLGDKLKHVIEPHATYRYVGGIDSSFDKLIHFDSTELITNTNELQVSLMNRLFAKQKDGSTSDILDWEVSQKRYFDPTFGGAVVAGQRNVFLTEADLTGYSFINGPRNYSPVVSALRLNTRLGIEWRVDYDPLLHHVSNSGATLDYRWANFYVSVGHNQVRSDPILSPSANQFRAALGIGRDNRRGWNAGLSAYYDARKSALQYLAGQVTYNTDCCGLSVQYRRFAFGTRDETQFRVAFAISNISTFGTLRRQEKLF